LTEHSRGARNANGCHPDLTTDGDPDIRLDANAISRAEKTPPLIEFPLTRR
jgi:hypothetical protein